MWFPAELFLDFSRIPLHMMRHVASSVDCPATATSRARHTFVRVYSNSEVCRLICSSTKQAHQHTIVKKVAQLPNSATSVPLSPNHIILYSEQATSMGINLYTHNKHTLFVQDLQT